MKPVTTLLPARSLDDAILTYVIMGTRYRGQWIFVRHHQRVTWEMPAGHIEPGEDPDQAALRELYEEAGVTNASLTVVSDYAVTIGNKTGYGRLYRADVKEIGPLPQHEILEIKQSRELPSRLTYPEVQTALFSLLTLH
jgi:8-oxo-dGTP diphosphatase